MCHTRCVTFITFVRQPSPSRKQTAMPRKHSKNVCVGYVPSNGASQDGVILKPKSCGATVRPCGVPSRMMDARLWKPQGSNSTPASPP
jgi:hypothetical protein